MKKFDVVIIGGGIGGLMAAHRIANSDKSASVVILEQGKPIEKRVCPIVAKKSSKCVKCDACAIMEGMAGAGAFSDGKYIISTEYGGWLTEFLPEKTVIDYIEQADKILVESGATTERYKPSDELKRKCLKYDLHMNQAEVKHLGTDYNQKTMKNLIDNLPDNVEIHTGTKVVDVDKEGHIVKTVSADGEGEYEGKYIIFAVGRVGSGMFSQWCERNGIELQNNQVDIGVRVELPRLIWEDFSNQVYEPKIWYRSQKYGDVTRMFCFNVGGNVVTENTNGILSVNGHSYADPARRTQNSNFALLATMKFTEPFKNPIEYARRVAGLANLLSGDSILVQRFGDLVNGRRSDEKRMLASTTRPTLNAVPGDLSLCLPKRQLDNIIETLYALDKIAPGTANYDTLLYGVECKYYSARPENEDFEIKGCKNIYAIGDGAGITRSLSQAAANGLYIGDKILKLG
ncbi:MAG: FAD-binding protein [Firmicutes bacterium]|nr:FAD-binding protein [Bacillota bacterium]